MFAIAESLQKEYPQTNLDYATLLIPLRDEFFGTTRPLLLTLLGAVIFVLLCLRECCQFAGGAGHSKTKRDSLSVPRLEQEETGLSGNC